MRRLGVRSPSSPPFFSCHPIKKGREHFPCPFSLRPIFIGCRYRLAGVTDPKGLQQIVPALLACSSFLVDKRFSCLFVAVLQSSLPVNDAHSLFGAAGIGRTTPFWTSSVKDTDSATINVMMCHFGTARGSSHGRPLADTFAINLLILFGIILLRFLFSFMACLMP